MKNGKAFTLIEIMIALAIFSIILGATYSVLSMGRSSFYTGDIQIVVQQEARKAMDKMTREIREASSVNLSDDYPFLIQTNRIKYEVNSGQLQRIVQGGSTTALANNIGSVQFTLIGGDIVYITLTTQKNTVLGRNLSADLISQVKLRN